MSNIVAARFRPAPPFALRCAGKRESVPQPPRRECEHACYTRRARAIAMRCTLVVPGLLDWPASALASVEKQAPALARLIATGGAPKAEQDGAIATACRVCGIARQQDWPVAPWLARAAGIEPGGAYWLCAEPAQFIVGASEVRLGGLVADLQSADAQELVAMLNAHFAGDGLRFVAPTPSHWFTCMERPPRMITRSPQAALGAPLLPYLASGEDGARGRGWQNELQMLLFEHPVNRRREAAGQASVDSVWLWGGGTLAKPEPACARIFANGGLVRALGGSVGLALAPLPGAFDALPVATAPVVWLDAIAADAGGAPLSVIDRAWIAPAERALRSGAFGEVELVITGRALGIDFCVPRPSLAQRWRRRFARPQVGTLLARWAAEAS